MSRKYKNEWQEPKLIILSRGRPEEVLTGDCKHPSTPVGAAGADIQCKVLVDSSCNQCFSQNNKS